MKTSNQLSDRVPLSLDRVGRYRIDKRLPAAGFAEALFQGFDEELQRPVVVQIPPIEIVKSDTHRQAYLAEARAVARLDHPRVGSIFDVGSADGVPCYVIAKLVEGEPLSLRLRRSPLDPVTAADLIATLASTLHYVHQQGLVHGAVTPRNIMLDESGTPHLTNFEILSGRQASGASLHPTRAAYLSPEQARLEGHRIDCRSDLFSLGVIMYELLAGALPFAGNSVKELLQQIIALEPPPPAQSNRNVSTELQRICLRALEKRAADRYPSGEQLAADLRTFLDAERVPSDSSIPAVGHTVPSPTATKIVPKGLQSFDREDSDFFLELLPGARDRMGLPRSIRFWKTRIEERDSVNTFQVGVIYGPSGCGKSSLIKAGLLPRISDTVASIYVEASSRTTEAQLMERVHHRLPSAADSLGLVDTLSALRQGIGLPADMKVLVVIDQFEQWLHSHDDAASDLATALRHCDGARLQCLLLVRDDFWMATNRFMRQLDIDTVEDHNAMAVDLFSVGHATKILEAYGRSFGALPEAAVALTADQKLFLKQAVDGLAEDESVVAVQLATFAEMIKDKSWDTATLRRCMGTQGVVATFLEEAFDPATAPPQHRFHERAARAVLATLLPSTAANIKGERKSRCELVAAAGYDERSEEFSDLVQLLDRELRLITPVDDRPLDVPDSSRPEVTEPATRQYQLTHDFLVQPLRNWLTRKQQETRSGRAQLRLAERTETWQHRREQRQLPALWEYVNMRLFTDKRQWIPAQRTMMNAAARALGVRWGVILLVVAVIGGAVRYYVTQAEQRSRVQAAARAVAGVLEAAPEDLPDALEFAKPFRAETAAEFREVTRDEPPASARGIHAALALAQFGQLELDYLAGSVMDAEPSEQPNLMHALMKDRDASIDALHRKLRTLGGWEPARKDEEMAGQLVAFSTRHRVTSTEGDLEGDEEQQLESMRDRAFEFDQDRRRQASDERVHWRRKARLAITLLELGEPMVAREMCRLGASNYQLTAFLNTIQQWPCDPNRLLRHVAASDEADWRAAACFAVGTFKQVGDDAKSDWTRHLKEWYWARDSLTHSAADWLRRRWNLPEITDTSRPQRADVRDWYVTPVTGLTMIRLEPGSFYQGYFRSAGYLHSVAEAYHLSDREITNGLFHQFVVDAEYRGLKPEAWPKHSEEAPTSRHPAQRVSWYEAVMFCNWLSWKEGRTPYYRVTKDDSKNQSRLVECDEAADGFRLPTREQWEYACSAGTTTPYSYGPEGADPIWLATFSKSGATTSVVGTRMCNPWGFFDMHGNVWEWCWDGREDGTRLAAGGSFFDRGIMMKTHGGTWWDARLRRQHGGFRVALPDRS